MKANVSIIIKDWKESWEGKDITALMNRMPADNIVDTPVEPTSDNDIMVSCPISLAKKLDQDIPDGGILYSTWLMDFSWDEDGIYWDGNVLVIFKEDKTYSMGEWEVRIENLYG